MDVLVIGGGPAGSVAARKCAERGLEVTVVEDHGEIGRPVRCGGLVSPRALETCGLDSGSDFVLREIRGAHVHSPSGGVTELDGRRTRALVVDREAMDRRLADMAVEAGAELRLETSAGIEGLDVHVDGVPVEPEVVVDASGARCLVGKDHGLMPYKVVPAYQATIQGAETLSEDFVEVFLGNYWAPGFFSWAIPVDGGARVGLGTDPGENPRKFVDRFFDEHPAGERLSGEIVSIEPGPIPMGPPRRTVVDRFLMVGDAAGQAKPTSGGGVYTGAVAARSAARAAAGFILDGKSLGKYESLWRSRIGGELWFGMRVHRALSRASDDEIERFVETVEGAMSLVRRRGDIDHPSALAKSLLSKPSYARSVLGILLRTLI